MPNSTIPEMRSPLHPFGLAAIAKSADDSCGVWAHEVTGQAYIVLRGSSSDAKFAEAVSGALGMPLPVEPCTFVSATATKVLWLSPDEWMIVTPRERLAGCLQTLNTALTGIRSQVTDNSGGYTQVIIEGRNASEALAHTTVYDLHALMFGRVVGTTFGKSSVYLYRQGDAYCLLLRRSFADYIWRYLVRAAQPYGFGVARLNGSTLTSKDAAQ
jgi:sarcosine oxidase, subunit gamma